MKISQECIIELIEANGFTITFVDSHGMAGVTYYFGMGEPSLSFSDSCISYEVVLHYLTIFSLQHNINRIQNAECLCNW